MQIRNLATVAGNLCRAAPSADMAPILIALGANVKLVGPAGERSVPLADFFAGPGRTVLGPAELLVEILVPPPLPGQGACYIKHSPRRAMDLAAVGVAAALVLDGGVCRAARPVLGAVAPTPRRCGAGGGQALRPTHHAGARCRSWQRRGRRSGTHRRRARCGRLPAVHGRHMHEARSS